MKSLCKKSFAVFLSAVLLLSVLPFTVSAATIVNSGTTGDCTWTLDSEGTLTISGNGSMGNYDNSNAPWKYRTVNQAVIEEGVTHIGRFAFEYCSRLISVSIPDSVTSIGRNAFQYCSKLTSVTIPASITRIDFCVFYGCYRLSNIMVDNNNNTFCSIDGNLYNRNGTDLIQYAAGKPDVSFTIPNSVTSINIYAFSDCDRLTSVTIPDSVTSIALHSFSNCDGLTAVIIPDSVSYIGDYAFYNCNRLTTVTIPDSVTRLEGDAFSCCDDLLAITVDDNNNAYRSIDGNLYNKDGTILIQYAVGKSDLSFTIPNSVTNINNRAFADCASLTSVDIPDSVTSIDVRAFYNCNRLTSVTIPDSVTSIGLYAFADCPSLTSMVISGSETSIGENAFDGCASLTIYCVKYSLAEFYAINHNIPFVASVPVTYQVLADGTARITGYTGNGGDFVIPSDIDGYTVTSIGDEAFADCSSLTIVSIPNSVTSIGDDAFRNCDNLTIYCITGSYAETYANHHHIPFVATEDPAHFTYEIDQWDGTTKITGYTGNGGNVVIPPVIDGHTITGIGDRAFEYCYSLTAVTIPNGVTSIGDCAFDGCSSLTSVTIPDSVTAMGDWAFDGCSSLTSVTIPNGVTSIGGCAFLGCSSLTAVTIPDSVTSIGAQAFQDCSSLTAVTIPGSVTSIGFDSFTNVFEGCNKLASITVDTNNPKYDSRNNCNAIINTDSNQLITGCKTTVIPDTVTSIGDDAFSGVFSLLYGEMITIEIPGSVVSIGNHAFVNCDAFDAVRFSEGLTSIGKWAFSGCFDLTGIALPESLTDIGDYAFMHCWNLNRIAIPKNVTNIGEKAFSYCEHLTSMTVDSNNMVYDSRNNCNAIIETASNTLIAGCSETVIPNSVTNIGEHAFMGCHSLETMMIPNSVTSIGEDAFDSCDGLKTIMIPNSVTTIGAEAFDWCRGLTGAFIPDSVTVIGKNAFRYCNNLTIYGIAGSYAETYATQNNIPFVSACPSCGTLFSGETVEIVPAVAATYTQTGATQGLRCTHCGAWIIEPDVLGTKPIDFTIGDISGNDGVSIDDATFLQQYLAEFVELDLEDEETFLQADMNGDGYVNVKDVTEIQRKVAELI